MATIGGCQYTVFAEPEVVYETPAAIGVRYIAGGLNERDNERKAMQLISTHCGGRFQVTGRSGGSGGRTIDAVCVP